MCEAEIFLLPSYFLSKQKENQEISCGENDERKEERTEERKERELYLQRMGEREKRKKERKKREKERGQRYLILPGAAKMIITMREENIFLK